MAEGKRTSPRISTWMTNRFNPRNLNCRCVHSLETRSLPTSPPENQNTLCLLKIQGETDQDIQVQIIDMIPENTVCSFQREEKELKNRELKERELREKELREKELKEMKLRDQELKERESWEKELREREQKKETEKEKEKELRERELRGLIKKYQESRNKDSKAKDLGEKELKEKRLRDEELKEKESREKELKGKKLVDQELTEKELRDKELRGKESESSAKGAKKKLAKESESKGRKSILASDKERRHSENSNLPLVKDSSVQTSPEPENCCQNLTERIFRTLQSLEEQTQIRQDFSNGLTPAPERTFPFVESQSVGTDVDDRTFPSLESRGTQSEDTFRRQPRGIDSSFLNRTTSGYSTSSQKTWPTGNFARRLKERNDCLCCGSEGPAESEGSSGGFEKAEKRTEKKRKEQEKACPPALDITGIDFVQALLEIGEYTRNLESQLAKMNEAMKRSLEGGKSMKIDDKYLLQSKSKSPEQEIRKVNGEGEEEGFPTGASKLLKTTTTTDWRLIDEYVQPVKASTPKSPVFNEQQDWHSLPIYTGSGLEGVDLAEEENISKNEEPRSNQIQSEAEDFNENLQKNNNVQTSGGSSDLPRRDFVKKGESPLIIPPTQPPIASSTPYWQEEITPLNKSFLNEGNEVSPLTVPGSSIQTQSSNSAINAATSTTDFVELPFEKKNVEHSQSEENFRRNSSSARSAQISRRSSLISSELDSTRYKDLPPSKGI